MSESCHYPRSEKMNEFIRLKNHIFSEDMILYWSENPNIKTYYAYLNDSDDNEVIFTMSSQFIHDMKKENMFDNIECSLLSSRDIINLNNENDNNFEVVLNVVDAIPLGEVEHVHDSSIVLCKADEYVKLLLNDNDVLRKSLFNDNVRDFQVDSDVNAEIFDTIQHNPNEFILLNNGVTVVCDKTVSSNRRIALKNPQIVNGCQTSNVIYNAYKSGYDISKTTISLKVISTESHDVTNRIVRGTNKHNIVLDEVFEVTRVFHKELEDFVNSVSSNFEEDFIKIYYERRSKQYDSDSKIKNLQKFNLKTLTTEFIGTFLKAPHYSHRHESKLLEEYRNKIYIDKQSFMPYFLIALMRICLDEAFRVGALKKYNKKYKTHLLFITLLSVVGAPKNINNNKQIEKYCNDFIDSVNNIEGLISQFKDSQDLFERLVDDFVQENGENYRSTIKTSQTFTNLILSALLGEKLDQKEDTYRGTVIKTSTDRYGYPYGFISRLPNNIFFHSNSNNKLNFDKLMFKDVTYEISNDIIDGREIAVNVKVIR